MTLDDDNTLRWFGKDYGAPVNRDCPQVPTPTGAICVLCDKAVKADDDGFIDAGGSIEHRRCLLGALGIEKMDAPYVTGC